MTWDELRAIAARGFEIGSHTESHPRLTTLSDADLELELRRSRERIEQELGRPCPLVAYPFSDCDARVEQAAEAAGYTAAFAGSSHKPVNRFAIRESGSTASTDRVVLRSRCLCSAGGRCLPVARSRLPGQRPLTT